MARPILRRGGVPGRVAGGLGPFGEFESMWQRMGQLLEQAAAPTTAASGGAWLPMAEVDESDDSFTVKVELPGYPADSIDIGIEGDDLVISGELSEEHTGEVLSRRQGGFMYRTGLPAGTDSEHCDAELDNGVLTVTVHKTGQRQQRRKIEIGQGGGRQALQEETNTRTGQESASPPPAGIRNTGENTVGTAGPAEDSAAGEEGSIAEGRSGSGMI